MVRTPLMLAHLFAGLLLVSACGEADDDHDDTTPTEGGTAPGTTDGGAASGTDSGWTEEERFAACDVASHDGAADAVAELQDCVCVEEEIYASWSMNDYGTVLEQYCYWHPYMEMFLQYCQENCEQTTEFVACCAAVEEWARKQQPDTPEWTPF